MRYSYHHLYLMMIHYSKQHHTHFHVHLHLYSPLKLFSFITFTFKSFLNDDNGFDDAISSKPIYSSSYSLCVDDDVVGGGEIGLDWMDLLLLKELLELVLLLEMQQYHIIDELVSSQPVS